MDAPWFKKKIVETHGNQRAFARRLRGPNGKPISQSAVSRTLAGQRQFQVSEIRQYARLLGVPVLEILLRAGILSRAELRSRCDKRK